jgi:hypothetical protein
MKKATLFLLLLVSLGITTSYASFPQRLRVCVYVIGNTEPHLTFHAGFKSSDIFDVGKLTTGVNNGTACVEHTYKVGPKNIKLKAIASSHSIAFQKSDDNSCSYMLEGNNCVPNIDYHSKIKPCLVSDFQSTSKPVESWTFIVKQINSKLYQASCSRN